MQAGIALEVLGGFVGISIGILVLGIIILSFNSGFFDFVNFGFDKLSYFLGDDFTNIIIAVLSVGLLIMFARRLLSFIGDNAGHSANS